MTRWRRGEIGGVTKMKWLELNQEQQRDLDYKIEKARWVIGEALAVSHRPVVAFSGGKDSTVLLDLIQRYFPEQAQRVAVVYGNTGVEFPECVKWARSRTKELGVEFYEACPGSIECRHYKYAAQRRIWQRLIDDGTIGDVLKEDGKLTSTLALERACPGDLAGEFEAERLIWRAGMRKSYFWCVDQYGWPLLGKAWSKLKARRINIDTFLRYSESQSEDPKLLSYYEVLRDVKISQACCDVLKKEPAERVQQAIGADLVFKGLMASESRTRAINFITRGYLFEGRKKDYLQGDPFFHCQPMAVWIDEDVWQYIRRFEVPYARLYDMTFYALDGSVQHVKRNGCMFCATDLRYSDNHLYALRQTHPKAWRAIMKAGLGEQIRRLQRVLRSAPQLELFDMFTTEELIEAQPCVFDDLDGLGGRPDYDGLSYDPEAEVGL